MPSAILDEDAQATIDDESCFRALRGAIATGCKPSVTVTQMSPETIQVPARSYRDITSKEALETVIPQVKLEDLGEPSKEQTIKWLDAKAPAISKKKFGPAYLGMFEAIRDCLSGALSRPHSFMGLVADEHDHSYAATYQVLAVKYGSQNTAEDVSNAHQFAISAGVPAKDSILGYFLLSRARGNDWIENSASRKLLAKCFEIYPKSIVVMKEYASSCESGQFSMQDPNGRLLPVIGAVPDFKTAISIRKRILRVAHTDDDNADHLCRDMFFSGDPDGAKKEAGAYLASLPVVTAKQILQKFSPWLTDFVGAATFIDGRRRAIVYSFPQGGKKASDYLVSYVTSEGKVLKPEHYKPVVLNK